MSTHQHACRVVNYARGVQRSDLRPLISGIAGVNARAKTVLFVGGEGHVCPVRLLRVMHQENRREDPELQRAVAKVLRLDQPTWMLLVEEEAGPTLAPIAASRHGRESQIGCVATNIPTRWCSLSQMGHGTGEAE